MHARADFELKIVDSLQAYPARDGREGITAADLVATPADVLESLKATRGAPAVLKHLPQLENAALWLSTAYFSVCQKTGTAQYLDIWDADHFDGFTDMQRCLHDCRAWFSGDGYVSWGSGQTKSGRVNCYFIAPTTGHYVCNARLQSYPANSQAMVECLIDNSSFGVLSVNGTINQPHLSQLSAGGHHFRIRQASGSFFFLTLTVWTLAEVAS